MHVICILLLYNFFFVYFMNFVHLLNNFFLELVYIFWAINYFINHEKF